MFEREIWMCPVCGLPLYSEQLSMKCANRHNFDRSRKGAFYLLPSNRKHAKLPGDNPEMVRARRDFLRKGYYNHLMETICEAACHIPDGGILLDAGCGEGYYTSGMCDVLEKQDVSLYGVDISKTAANYAARSDERIQCAVASVFHLPVCTNVCDMVVSIFAPYCGEEFRRVLKPDGYFVMAIPAARHLWELKCAVYDTPYENEVKNYDLEGFTFLKKYTAEREVYLDNQTDIANLFTMTPYAYRTGAVERERLAALETLTTLTAFEVLVYRKA